MELKLYEHNASPPYETRTAVKKIAFMGDYSEPCGHFRNSPYTIAEINNGIVHWAYTAKEYLFFEAYIEDDVVTKSNFEFYFTDSPNEIRFFRQSDGSYNKICIGTIKLKSGEPVEKAKKRAVKVVQDEFYRWMVMNKL